MYFKERLSTKENLLKFSGTYIMDDEDSFSLTYENGSLFGDFVSENKLQLIPISENKFKVDGFYPTIFVSLKQLKNKTKIAIIEQPLYSQKMVGIKTE